MVGYGMSRRRKGERAGGIALHVDIVKALEIIGLPTPSWLSERTKVRAHVYMSALCCLCESLYTKRRLMATCGRRNSISLFAIEGRRVFFFAMRYDAKDLKGITTVRELGQNKKIQLTVLVITQRPFFPGELIAIFYFICAQTMEVSNDLTISNSD